MVSAGLVLCICGHPSAQAWGQWKTPRTTASSCFNATTSQALAAQLIGGVHGNLKSKTTWSQALRKPTDDSIKRLARGIAAAASNPQKQDELLDAFLKEEWASFLHDVPPDIAHLFLRPRMLNHLRGVQRAINQELQKYDLATFIFEGKEGKLGLLVRTVEDHHYQTFVRDNQSRSIWVITSSHLSRFTDVDSLNQCIYVSDEKIRLWWREVFSDFFENGATSVSKALHGNTKRYMKSEGLENTGAFIKSQFRDSLLEGAYDRLRFTETYGHSLANQANFDEAAELIDVFGRLAHGDTFVIYGDWARMSTRERHKRSGEFFSNCLEQLGTVPLVRFFSDSDWKLKWASIDERDQAIRDEIRGKATRVLTNLWSEWENRASNHRRRRFQSSMLAFTWVITLCTGALSQTPGATDAPEQHNFFAFIGMAVAIAITLWFAVRRKDDPDVLEVQREREAIRHFLTTFIDEAAFYNYLTEDELKTGVNYIRQKDPKVSLPEALRRYPSLSPEKAIQLLVTSSILWQIRKDVFFAENKTRLSAVIQLYVSNYLKADPLTDDQLKDYFTANNHIALLNLFDIVKKQLDSLCEVSFLLNGVKHTIRKPLLHAEDVIEEVARLEPTAATDRISLYMTVDGRDVRLVPSAIIGAGDALYARVEHAVQMNKPLPPFIRKTIQRLFKPEQAPVSLERLYEQFQMLYISNWRNRHSPNQAQNASA